MQIPESAAGLGGIDSGQDLLDLGDRFAVDDLEG
jgi:hypothetical protein